MTTPSHNFIKRIFLATLLATTGASFAELSNQAISDVYENKLEGAAKYLEYFLVFQPNNKIQSESMQTNVAISATTAALLLLTTKKDKEQKLTVAIDIPTLIASGLVIAAGGYAYLCSLEKSIKRETLLKFLSNWEHHKQYLPAEFVTAFDELAAYVQAKGNLSNAQIGEIFELVQHYIEHCFEKRYPKEKKSLDMLGSLKTITDIGKNVAGK
ncbi:hypothetical protein A3J41_03215 [candidate division TM6 bacterium RIFCSPHIGHO2_12_FULL_38_8]|nr:MAG: hypothetical protein A3J41_03215 [candidate division TM6 bacterium RIFCSPHIGHO2_12_FULL_38_8]